LLIVVHLASGLRDRPRSAQHLEPLDPMDEGVCPEDLVERRDQRNVVGRASR